MEPDRFLAAVRNPRSLSIFDDYDFLQSLPANGSLEGFLFPDTYRLPVLASTPELVIASSWTISKPRWATTAGGRQQRAGAATTWIKLASIVEREAVQADERPLIAGVYVNRLNGTCQSEVGGRYLQLTTVQYARGTVGDWWWKPQRIEEYAQVISPYNTYLNEDCRPIPSPTRASAPSKRRATRTRPATASSWPPAMTGGMSLPRHWPNTNRICASTAINRRPAAGRGPTGARGGHGSIRTAQHHRFTRPPSPVASVHSRIRMHGKMDSCSVAAACCFLPALLFTISFLTSCTGWQSLLDAPEGSVRPVAKIGLVAV
ncbi:MAG: endolytic transglycosylase MltG [Caldilineaceae bacterium]